MNDTLRYKSKKNKLNRNGKREVIAVVFLRPLMQFALLFGVAGTFDWINAWIYCGLFWSFGIVYTAIMLKKNPGLLNERGMRKKDIKSFDKILVPLYFLAAFTTLIIGALDYGHYHWATMSMNYVIVGVVFTIAAFVFILWAMITNTHFEGFVRIQKDRNHQVCSSGPYKIVRHPGYTGMGVIALTVPLTLGTWWALVAGGAAVFVLIIRTAMEDHTLQSELSGYKDYTKITPYRLVPLIW